jgi:photosystem II stability/assembly factor-like uncharacterized protein
MNRNSPSSAAHPVLGAPSGTPLVLGQPAPAGTGQLGAVSCADATRCWAVGVAGPNSSAALPATVIIATKDGGVKWVPQAVHGSVIPQLSGISCPTTNDCMAVGSTGASLPGSDVVYTTADGGTNWSPATGLPGALDMQSVQCNGVSDCTAITSSGSLFSAVHTADFGQTWQTEGNLPAGFFGDGRLSCTDTGTCLVAGYVPTTVGHGQGAIALSADGGQTWALATVPASAGVLQSAICLTATTCLAAGTTGTTVSDVVPAQGEVLYSADGGHTWTTAPPAASIAASTSSSTTSTTSLATTSSTTTSPAQAPATPPVLSVDDVYGVACPSARVCALVGTRWKGQPPVATGAVAESRDGGTTFAAASAAYIPLALSALSCPTATNCIAVGGNTVARLTLLPAPRPVPKAPIRADGDPQG